MKKWIFRSSLRQGAPEDWQAKLGISGLFLNILYQRGLDSIASINNYLDSRLSLLTPPGRWPQIPNAAKILVNELLAGKKLAIWGDYDVDGITATALVLDVLEAHGFSVVHHLPERLSEGYGLNSSAIEELAAQGCNALLTVDCGIGDAKSVARAKELGLTVIISDHHIAPANLPEAECIVDPRTGNEQEWPSCNLAGVGVAFYLMAAVNALLEPHTGRRYKMDNVLDLVALGTLADVMLLDAENRILVRAGLQKMSRPERPGIRALKVSSGFELAAELNSGQTVFRLAPRINAAGRMGNPELALQLLRSRDYQQALLLARQLEEYNDKRKSEEDRIHRQARAQAEELLEKDDYAALVLYGSDWHPGIVGIVASRIVEEFNLPTIVLCEYEKQLKGSGRSVSGFDLHGALVKCDGLLNGYGGHKMAAGVRLNLDNLEPFRKAFSEAAVAELGATTQIPELMLECELDFRAAANYSFLQELQLMQPFGPGNAEPVFSSPPLRIKAISPIGRNNEHVRLQLIDLTTDIQLSAKAWRMADQFTADMVGQTIRLAYTPKLDSYRGLPEIDLAIKDWRLDKSGII